MKMCKLCKDCEALAGSLVCADCFERGHNITPDIGDDDGWPEEMTPALRNALAFMGALPYDLGGGCNAIRFEWLDDGKERTYTHIVDAYTVTPEVRDQWRRDCGPSTGHAISATDDVWKDGTRWVEPTCPLSLNDQCATIYYRETFQDGEWVADMGLSDGDEAGQVAHFDTVREALREIYGPIAGCPIPDVFTAEELNDAMRSNDSCELPQGVAIPMTRLAYNRTLAMHHSQWKDFTDGIDPGHFAGQDIVTGEPCDVLCWHPTASDYWPDWEIVQGQHVPARNHWSL